MSDLDFEKKYNELTSNLQAMHKKNVRKTSLALKSLLIIPTIFLILLFMTNSSKTIFLVLWIASMFIIAAILIVVEYQDYNLRQMMVTSGAPEEASETTAEDASADTPSVESDDDAEEVPEEITTWAGEVASELAAWADEVSDDETSNSSEVTADS